MIDINIDLFKQSTNFSIKQLLVVVSKMRIFPAKNQLINCTKPIIRKFKKRKVHSSFIDNILGADLADMQLIKKFNKGFRF